MSVLTPVDLATSVAMYAPPKLNTYRVEVRNKDYNFARAATEAGYKIFVGEREKLILTAHYVDTRHGVLELRRIGSPGMPFTLVSAFAPGEWFNVEEVE